MLKFFRTIRKKLIEEDNVRKYLLYAIGEILLVVIGILIALQLNNWNEARADAARRDQINEALIAYLTDATVVLEMFIKEIDAGISGWEAQREAGGRPAPFIFRMGGSYTPPDTWDTLEQMNPADLFDPVTLFDLTFYFSRSQGVGERYVHYVRFVEDEIGPFVDDPAYFYAEDGAIGPRYAASMARLNEFRDEFTDLGLWGRCLIYRLRSTKRYDQTCIRAGFHLPGMTDESGSAP
jgi:hypothetical protein